MEYLLFLQNIREASPILIQKLFILISEMILYVGPVVPVIIFLSVDKKKGSIMGFNIVVALALNSFIKLTACVYRPWIKYPNLSLAEAAQGSATGYSFPSGHTTTATSVYGSIAILNKKRKIVVVIMIIMILLTAFARNFLGAHTLQDVLVAIVVTSLVMAVNSFVLKKLEENPKIDVAILIACLIFAFGGLIYYVFKSYPMDYDLSGALIVDPKLMMKDGFQDMGFLAAWVICWFVERRYINFSVEGTKKERILRSVIAIVIFAILYFGVFSILKGYLDPRAYKFFKNFLTIICVVGIYPFFVKKMQDKKSGHM